MKLDEWGTGTSFLMNKAVSKDSAEIGHTAVNEHFQVGSATDSKYTCASNRATAQGDSTILLLDTLTS